MGQYASFGSSTPYPYIQSVELNPILITCVVIVLGQVRHIPIFSQVELNPILITCVVLLSWPERPGFCLDITLADHFLFAA